MSMHTCPSLNFIAQVLSCHWVMVHISLEIPVSINLELFCAHHSDHRGACLPFRMLRCVIRIVTHAHDADAAQSLRSLPTSKRDHRQPHLVACTIVSWVRSRRPGPASRRSLPQGLVSRCAVAEAPHRVHSCYCLWSRPALASRVGRNVAISD